MAQQVLPVSSATSLNITRGDPVKFILNKLLSGDGGSTTSVRRGGGSKSGGKFWSEGYSIEGAPDWWKGLIPTGTSANSIYAAVANSMIPFMSSEDQQAIAQNLYLNYNKSKSKPFAGYSAEVADFGTPATQITPEITKQFTSSERARNALKALDTLAGSASDSYRRRMRKNAGYKTLRQILSVMENYGGTDRNRQTRAEYSQLQTALSPLVSSLKNTQYEALASALTTPTFTAGNVVQISKNSDTGQYTFGVGNKGLY